MHRPWAPSFQESTVPDGWSVGAWNPGNLASVAGGQLSIDGSRVSADVLLPAGQTLEFAATFSTDTYEHAGFGVTFNETPWAMFSTYGGTGLYARTNDGSTITDTLIPGNWVGAPHRYRIDWSGNSVVFSIDGTQVATNPAVIAATMRPIVSDYNVGGGALSVDWVRMTPYATSATFTSRVIDAGAPIQWSAVTWSATTPVNTTLSLSARFGNSPTPDGSWTGFQALAASGSAVTQTSRYVQYQVLLGGIGQTTPMLQDVSFSGVVPPTIVGYQ